MNGMWPLAKRWALLSRRGEQDQQFVPAEQDVVTPTHAQGMDVPKGDFAQPRVLLQRHKTDQNLAIKFLPCASHL